MKIILKTFFALFIVAFTGCDSLIDNKPAVSERNVTFRIKLVDSTGALKKVYGNSAVKKAEVILKSNALGTVYNLVSDDQGFVTLSNAISDKYVISAVRLLTPLEVEKGIGNKSVQEHKLVNFNAGIIELRADYHKVVEVCLDKVLVQSPLVISEIYACGPPKAGLYFHDKYIEIFNNSDEVQYLDSLLVMQVYANVSLGFSYVNDSSFVHSKNIWMFPGTGRDYPIKPGQFVVAAGDAIDHRINAPYSVDLSKVSFEFYKKDAPDIDNKNIPNMIMFYQSAGNDWLIGGESDALVIARVGSTNDIIWENDHYKVPMKYVLDGAEYLSDPTRLDKKKLYPGIDASATGGITFYTGKTMERLTVRKNGRLYLKDSNNSSLDFKVYSQPSPEYHNEN